MKIQKFRKILCVETRIRDNWPSGYTSGSLGSCRGPGRQRTQTLVLCFLGLSARFGRPGRPGVNQV